MHFSAFEILNILIFELAGWKVRNLERYGVSKTPFIMESWGELLSFRKHLFLWDFSILETFKHAPNPEHTNMKGIFVYPKVWCYPTFQSETLPGCHVPLCFIQVEGFLTNNLMFIGAPLGFYYSILGWRFVPWCHFEFAAPKSRVESAFSSKRVCCVPVQSIPISTFLFCDFSKVGPYLPLPVVSRVITPFKTSSGPFSRVLTPGPGVSACLHHWRATEEFVGRNFRIASTDRCLLQECAKNQFMGWVNPKVVIYIVV